MQLLYLLILFSSITCNVHQHEKSFDDIRSEYVSGIKKLNLSGLQLNFKENILADNSMELINRQITFFKKSKEALGSVKIPGLDSNESPDYDLMKYQIDFNIERLELESKTYDKRSSIAGAESIYEIPNGKAWYQYFLKRWLGDNVSPDEIYQSGIAQITRAQQNIQAIRIKLGFTEDEFYIKLNDSSFFLDDEATIKKNFEDIKQIVSSKIQNIFLNYNIADVEIKRGTNKEFSQTPGYYSENVFYFNLFNKPYNTRQMDWLFIHEAVPGHHFQNSVASGTIRSDVQQLFWYPGYGEGWAAYVEEYGHELGLYKTPYEELGRWEWDIVRSVRVALDVGINYYGWNDRQALDFWKKNIKNQDDIAIREINRMKRWPVQVITYKYGALQFLTWKKKMQLKEGASFNIRNFHNELLKRGGLPFVLLKKYFDYDLVDKA
ncbi:MAG: DUF885 domain-containing protein [Ginsengibacter sp.]